MQIIVKRSVNISRTLNLVKPLPGHRVIFDFRLSIETIRNR